ncbi:MAG: acyltransferase family protein [Pseudomonadota bacterium]
MAIQYRPEIDGLRALAVLAVIVYHAEFLLGDEKILQGGFIGVDVFFVISGYLITKIILREMDAGSFSFLHFYQRRARRILPALFTVMAASIAYAWALLLPKAMQEFAGSGLASLAFGSNFWFWLEDSYTAEPSSLKPLLHTWSLSVEEQFYVLFPLLMLLIFRFARSWLMVIFVVLFVASLSWASYLSAHAPDSNFFLLPSRGWELLAGALLVRWEANRPRGHPRWMSLLLPGLGVLLIVLALIFMRDDMAHPSLITLASVFGCMLVIMYGGQGDFISRILASRPLVFIGLTSYSLYLWHFPVFVFARVKEDFDSNTGKLEAIAISTVLALIAYYLVETPARKRLGTRTFTWLTATTFAGLLAVFSWIYLTDGARFRVSDDISSVVEFNYWDDHTKEKIFSTHRNCWLVEDDYDLRNPFAECRAAEPTNTDLPEIMLIGDSHAGSLLPGLVQQFAGRAQILQRVKSNCIPILARLRPQTDTNPCFAAYTQVFDELEERQPEVVIISGRWRPVDYAKLTQQLQSLKQSIRSRIVLVGAFIYWDPPLPERLKQELETSPLQFPELLAPHTNTFVIEAAVKQIAIETEVHYLSLTEAFCEQQRCRTRVNNKADGIVAWDHDHLTQASSEFLLSTYEPLLSKLLEANP